MITLRQIPQETVFMSNADTSYQDKLVKNRIHFSFPKNWSTNQNKTNIVGIRSMYITKGYRNAEISVQVTLNSVDNLSDVQKIESHTIKIDKFFDDYTPLKDFITKLNEKFRSIEWEHLDAPNFEPNLALKCYYEFILDQENPDFHKSRFVMKSPYNDLPEEDRTVKKGTSLVEWMIYYFEFQILSVNDDCKQLLKYIEDTRTDDSSGKEDKNKYAQPIYTYDVWDRNSCIIFSNLAYMSEKSFLGHTRKHENKNIKYFELTNNNQSFWVDLFAAVDHKAPVYLPDDGKEELYIEAQLLTSSNAVL